MCYDVIWCDEQNRSGFVKAVSSAISLFIVPYCTTEEGGKLHIDYIYKGREFIDANKGLILY